MRSFGTRRVHSLRQTFLGSVAGIGLIALAAAGGSAYHHVLPSLTAPAQAAETATQPASGFADLVAKVKPAVISVRVRVEESGPQTAPGDRGNDNVRPSRPESRMQQFFRRFGFDDRGRNQITPRPRRVMGVGSGFFISADGYAVTNNHVVNQATSLQVTTDDGAIYAAKVVGTDPTTDLALIKVNGKDNFPYAQFSDRAPRIGEWVVAVGNPFGLGGTVTAGIVSAEGRAISSSPYDYIQIDAPINRGNSGGPTFDTEGNVIGINTAIFSPSGGSIGIGFAVPAAPAKTVIAQLKENGHVTRGWLGVSIQSITPEMAESLGMKEARGAIIDEPTTGSPAANAGLQAGDVITSLNGDPVKDSRDVARKVATLAPGTSVKLDLLREGQQKTLTVTLGERPNQQQASSDRNQSRGNEARSNESRRSESRPNESRPEATGPRLGLSVAPAAQVAGAGEKGVAVVGVDPDGSAADRGLKVGDIILDVGGKAVANADDVIQALKEASAQGKRDVLMHVQSADATRFVAVPLSEG